MIETYIIGVVIMAIVVPASQLVLMRKRKKLYQLMKEHKWDEVSAIELELYEDINRAVQDPDRSSKELLAELGSVISVYKELTTLCRLYSQQVVQ
jgi:hypothetical protein